MRPLFPSQLTLSHKLTDPEPVASEETLPQRIKSRGDVATFATRLNSTEQVSRHFPLHPLEGHVHIMVELLPPSKIMSCPVSCPLLIKLYPPASSI